MKEDESKSKLAMGPPGLPESDRSAPAIVTLE